MGPMIHDIGTKFVYSADGKRTLALECQCGAIEDQPKNFARFRRRHPALCSAKAAELMRIYESRTN